MIDINKVRQCATDFDWTEVDYQDKIGMVSFKKLIKNNPVRINVYLTTGTVATALSHPKYGKTQMFRKLVPYSMLCQIFKNPRLHTDKGYRKKDW